MAGSYARIGLRLRLYFNLATLPGAAMFRVFAKFIFRLLGWRIEDRSLPRPDNYIVIVAPHTSNWDFFLGLFARSLAHMDDVKFLGKKELFGPPFGWFFRAMGGYPVDRSQRGMLVDQVAELFRTVPGFKIAITPEGTRKRVDTWKTGFYHIAVKAHVPIIMVAFDYGRKCVAFAPPFWPTGDLDVDIEHMKAHFRPVKGKNPENGVH